MLASWKTQPGTPRGDRSFLGDTVESRSPRGGKGTDPGKLDGGGARGPGPVRAWEPMKIPQRDRRGMGRPGGITRTREVSRGHKTNKHPRKRSLPKRL